MSGRRQGFESRRPVQDGVAGRTGADRTAPTAAPHRSKQSMTSKFRVAAIAAAVFTFAGATLVSGPAQAWQGAIALPSVSYLNHASAALGRATLRLDSHAAATLGLDARAAAAPADILSLDALVANEAAGDVGDAEQECLANAVYFEA